MDKLQEIKEYLKQDHLKKVMFGGYNKEDIRMKFVRIVTLLDEYVKEQAEKESVMLADFESKFQAMQEEIETNKKVTEFLIGDLNKNISEMASQNKELEAEHLELCETIKELTTENERMFQNQLKIKAAYKSYCSEIVKRYSESLDTLSEEFNKMLYNVSSVQKRISEEIIIEGLENVVEMIETKKDE